MLYKVKYCGWLKKCYEGWSRFYNNNVMWKDEDQLVVKNVYSLIVSSGYIDGMKFLFFFVGYLKKNDFRRCYFWGLLLNCIVKCKSFCNKLFEIKGIV